MPVMYLTEQSNSLHCHLASMAEMFVSVHWDLVCVDEEIDYLSFAVAAVVVELEFVVEQRVAWQVTLLVLVTFVDVDEVTSEVLDSFVVITEEMVHDIVDYFRAVAVVWQVLVWNSVSKLVLVVEQQLAFLSTDLHNLATYYVPFDGASMQDCVLASIVDESAEWLAVVAAAGHSKFAAAVAVV